MEEKGPQRAEQYSRCLCTRERHKGGGEKKEKSGDRSDEKGDRSRFTAIRLNMGTARKIGRDNVFERRNKLIKEAVEIKRGKRRQARRSQEILVLEELIVKEREEMQEVKSMLD